MRWGSSNLLRSTPICFSLTLSASSCYRGESTSTGSRWMRKLDTLTSCRESRAQRFFRNNNMSVRLSRVSLRISKKPEFAILGQSLAGTGLLASALNSATDSTSSRALTSHAVRVVRQRGRRERAHPASEDPAAEGRRDDFRRISTGVSKKRGQRQLYRGGRKIGLNSLPAPNPAPVKPLYPWVQPLHPPERRPRPVPESLRKRPRLATRHQPQG